MLAIADKNSTDWTYIEYNTNQEAMLKLMIPEQVLTQLID